MSIKSYELRELALSVARQLVQNDDTPDQWAAWVADVLTQAIADEAGATKARRFKAELAKMLQEK